MASVRILKMDGTEAGSLDLNPAVFGAPANPILVHDVAVALQNAKRQGNAETKTRAQVSGGGAKPYAQKGTGMARHGSTREPEMRGGGSVWGPHKRSYRQNVPATFKRKALCSVLSERVRTEALCVLDDLACDAPKTKPMAEMFAKVVPSGKKTLFITADHNPNFLLSIRNLQRVAVTTAADLNAVDVLKAAQVVVEKAAVEKLEQRLASKARKEQAQ